MSTERPTIGGGVAPVVHLPLDDTGCIDFAQIRALVDRLVAAGVDGLVVLGLATEPWTLDPAERRDLTRAVVEAADGRVTVIAGVDGSTAEVNQNALLRLEDGADALMVRVPDPAQLRSHCAALASAELPVVIQDAPAATGVELATGQLIATFQEMDHIAAVKVERPAGGPRVTELVDAHVPVIAGWGGLHYTEQLRRGVIGCMPGSDLGPAFVRIHRLATTGQCDRAESLYRKLLPLLAYEAQSLPLLIQSAKMALVRFGVFGSSALRDGDAPDAVQVATLGKLFSLMSTEGVPGW